MAGRPKLRAAREARERANGTVRSRPTHEDLVEVYSEEFTTFQQLRKVLVQKGIVEHGLNPYEVIQRAIDDVSLDYLITRRKIDQDTNGDPNKLVDHELYEHMEHMRESMVRYSTFAMQYDIQKRQLKLSESRIALLAASLRVVLLNFDVPQDKIKEVPRMLIEAIKSETPWQGNPFGPKLNDEKANAMAELISGDDIEVEVVYEDTTPPS